MPLGTEGSCHNCKLHGEHQKLSHSVCIARASRDEACLQFPHADGARRLKSKKNMLGPTRPVLGDPQQGPKLNHCSEIQMLPSKNLLC